MCDSWCRQDLKFNFKGVGRPSIKQMDNVEDKEIEFLYSSDDDELISSSNSLYLHVLKIEGNTHFNILTFYPI